MVTKEERAPFPTTEWRRQIRQAAAFDLVHAADAVRLLDALDAAEAEAATLRALLVEALDGWERASGLPSVRERVAELRKRGGL